MRPVSAPNARQDEASIWKDSDNDGIMDFDEKKRFNTHAFDKDTDHDGVDDKSEIRQTIFDAQNHYIKKPPN